MFRLLLLLALYLPLENFLLKWLPVGDATYMLLRQIPEALLLAAVLVALRQRGRLPLIGGLADAALAAFVLLALLSMELNGALSGLALANLKALLRFTLVIYLVLLIEPDRRQLTTFGKAVLAGVGIQAMLGLAQWWGGIPVRDFLAARESEEALAGLTLRFTGARFAEVNDLMGTLGNTVNYGTFLLVGLTVALTRDGTWLRRAGWAALLLLCIYLTGSRASLLTALVVLLAFPWIAGHRRRATALALVAVAAAFEVLLWFEPSSDRQSLSFALTDEYRAIAMHQRLGLIVYVLPEFLTSRHAALGISPDFQLLVDFVRLQVTEISPILRSILTKVVEDVYWLALVFYYGLLGFAVFLVFLVSVFRRTMASLYRPGPARQAAIVGTTLLLATLPLNLFMQAFELRHFAFYLWAYVGLALSLARTEERHEHPAGQ